MPWRRLQVECVWNVMAHGDAREGKWRGNWRMEWVASTLHITSEHDVSRIITADAHNSAASSRLNWRPRAELNGLVRFGERRNLVSARVPSRFKSSLRSYGFLYTSTVLRSRRDFSFTLRLPFNRRMNTWCSWSFGPGRTTGRFRGGGMVKNKPLNLGLNQESHAVLLADIH